MSTPTANQMRAYRRKWKANGLCTRCGTRRRSKASVKCPPCLEIARSYERQRNGCGKWHKGGRGRPPTNG